MRALTRALVSAAAAVGLAAVPTAAAACHHHAVSTRLAVPAYFYPGQYWTQLGDAAPTVGLAVANPSSGPGSALNTDYATAISNARHAGVKVIGYVDTGYFGTTGRTTRDGQTSAAAWTAQIESDVDSWYSWYGGAGLAGIFFDDGLNDCGPGDEHVQLYIDIRGYVRDKADRATVIDNPGTGAEQCYTRAADTLVTFEGSYASYTGYQPPAWEASADPGQLWHLVYATPQSNLDGAVSLARSRNVGYLYVTPDDLPNPWDTLPTDPYWTQELNAVSV
jgi:spherulation-specific family 4 protein